jgi:hypothetical protein
LRDGSLGLITRSRTLQTPCGGTAIDNGRVFEIAVVGSSPTEGGKALNPKLSNEAADAEPYESIPSGFSLCGQEIVLPNVPGSPSAGAIIATRGLDAAVCGFDKRNQRVDVAGIDDPEG